MSRLAKRRRRLCLILSMFCVFRAAAPLCAAEPASPQDVHITRASGPIEIDGETSDAAWRDAARVDDWYETTPGDNTQPRVNSAAYLTFDDRYLYVAFEFSDPEPSEIRAPYAEPDNLASSHDYGGVYIDAANDGKTAMAFLATPRGVRYDAIMSDAAGAEDAAADFYWDAAAKVTDAGWTLEMRIPFASLRYRNSDPQTWGILLYRNWPRAYRYQMFATPIRRGVTCLVCQAAKLTGLSELPRGDHWTVAPYATLRQTALPEAGRGSPLKYGPVHFDGGVDVKWTPNAVTAVDLTLNPDFSQVEADPLQITTNERFALYVPEKRPFFLEGKDLFATPIQAVYTRSITSPDWGLRGTGRLGDMSYTALVTHDAGGGQVILPGPQRSSLANQDFQSTVGVLRARYDIDKSFASFLASVRENDDGSYSRVAGPDFTWRRDGVDRVTGQALFSRTLEPNRPDLTPRWTGQLLQSHAAWLEWSHSKPTYDWSLQARDIGSDFRADSGFVPQVGYRYGIGVVSYTFRPQDHFFSRIRPSSYLEYIEDQNKELLRRRMTAGVAMDGAWNSFWKGVYIVERLRVGARVVPFSRVDLIAQTNPSQTFSHIAFEAVLGQFPDNDNARAGSGGNYRLRSSVRPADRLEFGLNGEYRWLDAPPLFYNGPDRRVFTARTVELRTVFHFSSRSFLRLVGQYSATSRDPSMYLLAKAAREKAFVGTGLFAYRLNWQSVLFAGYGDARVNSPLDNGWDKTSRQWFLKASYAFQPK